MTTWKAAKIINFITNYISKFGEFPQIECKEMKYDILEALRRSHGKLYDDWKETPIEVKTKLLEMNKETEEYNLEKNNE